MFGGLCLTAAFPKIGLAGAAWVGPAVILFSAAGATPGKALKLGFAAGLVHFLTSLYWLLYMPYTFHGVPIAPALGWFSLSAYCSLFPAVWVWLCWRIWPGSIPSSSAASALRNFFLAPGLQRQLWTFNCAALWVATEMVRGRFLTGFPWNLLGISQYRMLPLVQIVSTTGVYGISFLIVWTSLAIGAACLGLIERPTSRYGPWGEAGMPLVVCAVVAAFGATKVSSIPQATRHLKAAMIQPSIPQSFIFDPAESATRFDAAMKLSEEALASKPDVLIWPESALPPVTEEMQSRLSKLVIDHHVWLIVSADDAKKTAGGANEYYNASFFIRPTGGVEGVYHKRRLVIFGEYIPLVKWLPFLRWLTPVDIGYTPGTDSAQFYTRDPSAKFSVLICFEDMFAQEARDHVEADTDFLVNLTNDGWFGESAEQWQQAASAVLRAVENGVPLLRCTNNGVTCWIDGQGRIRQIFQTASRGVYGEGFLVADIPLREPGAAGRTFYNQHGDWFGWACCGLALALMLRTEAARWHRARAAQTPVQP